MTDESFPGCFCSPGPSQLRRRGRSRFRGGTMRSRALHVQRSCLGCARDYRQEPIGSRRGDAVQSVGGGRRRTSRSTSKASSTITSGDTADARPASSRNLALSSENPPAKSCFLRNLSRYVGPASAMRRQPLGREAASLPPPHPDASSTCVPPFLGANLDKTRGHEVPVHHPGMSQGYVCDRTQR